MWIWDLLTQMINYPETDLQVWGFLLLLVFCLFNLCLQDKPWFSWQNEKKLQILGFCIFKRMIIQMKKEKVSWSSKDPRQVYSRLFWARNLEIYSKSKNVHVKMVSKGHTYISLCCKANTCSLQLEFFHEAALPHDCESQDGFWFLMHDQLSQPFTFLLGSKHTFEILLSVLCCGNKTHRAPCFEGLFIIFI